MTLDLFNAFTVTVTPQSTWWKYNDSNVEVFLYTSPLLIELFRKLWCTVMRNEGKPSLNIFIGRIICTQLIYASVIHFVITKPPAMGNSRTVSISFYSAAS